MDMYDESRDSKVIEEHRNCPQCFSYNVDYGTGPFEIEIDEDGDLCGLTEFFDVKLNGMNICDRCMDQYQLGVKKTLDNFSKVLTDLRFYHFRKQCILQNKYMNRIIFEYMT